MVVRLQSVIDVITNSSTSIYVAAGDWTLNAIKDIINTSLEIAGSDLKADDLFTFELGAPSYWEYESFEYEIREYIRKNLFTEEEANIANALIVDIEKERPKRKSWYSRTEKEIELDEQLRTMYDRYWSDDLYPIVDQTFEIPCDEYVNRRYYVKPIDTTNKQHEKLASLLTGLDGLFHIDACREG